MNSKNIQDRVDDFYANLSSDSDYSVDAKLDKIKVLLSDRNTLNHYLTKISAPQSTLKTLHAS